MDELENIQNHIYFIRGQRVMLDFDLAKLYEVKTSALNQAVKRNPKRFEGEEFMFQLTEEEWRTFKVNFFKSYHAENESNTNLRSQFVTANYIKKQRFYPYAFTEIGVAMLSSVLKSEVAIQANRKIMKAFVAYRHLAELPLAATYLDLRKQIEDLKNEVNDILADQNDINESTRAQLDAISTALAELQASRSQNATLNNRRPIGFIQPKDNE
jgi:hypothetical protein